MADARAVYEQFLLTPLKLKARRAPVADAEAQSDGRAPLFELVTETDDDEPAPAAAAELQASPEVERLRGRIEIADLTDAAAAEGRGGAEAGGASGGRKAKQKRAASAGARAGAAWADTPTRAGRPAKRSRQLRSPAAELDKENRDGGKDAALKGVARRISDAFDDGEEGDGGGAAQPDGANDSAATASTSSSSSSPPPAEERPCSRRTKGGKAAQTVRRSKRLAHQPSGSEDEAELPAAPPVDHLTPLCDALIATNTISGLVFALTLNALRLRSTVEISGSANPYATAFKIFHGIAQCEQLTQQQQKLPTVQLSPKRRYSGSARALEKLVRTTPKAKGSVHTAPAKKKKCVRFRSFDFSCLNLQYVGNERVAAMVDRMIASYGRLMEYVSTSLQQTKNGQASKFSPPSPTLHILQELSDVMADNDLLPLTGSPIDHPYRSEREASESSRILETAYSARDSAAQHEIRLASEYFAGQLKQLVNASSPCAFLHEMFSALISSTVRYKLRVIFLHSTHKDDDAEMKEDQHEEAEVDLTSPATLAAATYTHQDVGAAIHRALQESLLYLPLVSPLLEVLNQDHLEDQVGTLTEKLMECPGEDVERIDQFILS